jgi:hypothetical protein
MYSTTPMFNSTNRSKTVKRILASLFVTSVAICSASAANAQLTAESTHTGVIATVCKVEATDAVLVRNNPTLPTSISSNDGIGAFKTTCNSEHGLTIEKLSSANPTITTGTGYKTEFKLSGALGAYAALNTVAATTDDFVEAPVIKTGLPATGSEGHTIKVAAKGSVATGFLPAGTYTIKIKATVAAS